MNSPDAIRFPPKTTGTTSGGSKLRSGITSTVAASTAVIVNRP